MTLSRLSISLGAMLFASLASAQLDSDQKTQVLGEIDAVLSEEAFVPGVNLTLWRTHLERHQYQLDSAENPRQFAIVVNEALKELGLSHIVLLPSRQRHHGGEELSMQSLLQGRSFGVRGPQLGWIDKETAILRIPDFETSYDQNEVDELFDEAKDAKYLVLDLRGDPGGEVTNMRHFLGLFLPSKTPVGTFVSKKMADQFQKSKHDGTDPVQIAKWANQEIHPIASQEPFAGKVAVLIDGRSASAAEIVANSLHESLGSPLVGAPSMGAVLVSTFDRLSFGFRIQFPIGDYVSHSGHRLEGHPLTPDASTAGDDAIAIAVQKIKGT